MKKKQVLSLVMVIVASSVMFWSVGCAALKGAGDGVSEVFYGVGRTFDPDMVTRVVDTSKPEVVAESPITMQQQMILLQLQARQQPAQPVVVVVTTNGSPSPVPAQPTTVYGNSVGQPVYRPVDNQPPVFSGQPFRPNQPPANPVDDRRTSNFVLNNCSSFPLVFSDNTGKFLELLPGKAEAWYVPEGSVMASSIYLVRVNGISREQISTRLNTSFVIEQRPCQLDVKGIAQDGTVAYELK
jgi:hypothetical protein